ncbi:hypothetical protein OOU_Y34scaffold00106g2 [Pyricularia oryzae Y34]|uniref:Uncharacterized protein n=2 Tax=Pyricularia oryzae TaxID=318829 RepID=A0AA97PR55_PYRO3|nr:hypothetical protein OOU_Y34scaffold00106g2 [Pyricularia oryzae Y34]
MYNRCARILMSGNKTESSLELVDNGGQRRST